VCRHCSIVEQGIISGATPGIWLCQIEGMKILAQYHSILISLVSRASGLLSNYVDGDSMFIDQYDFFHRYIKAHNARIQISLHRPYQRPIWTGDLTHPFRSSTAFPRLRRSVRWLNRYSGGMRHLREDTIHPRCHRQNGNSIECC
jgi:hypothetical protein